MLRLSKHEGKGPMNAFYSLRSPFESLRVTALLYQKKPPITRGLFYCRIRLQFTDFLNKVDQFV